MRYPSSQAINDQAALDLCGCGEIGKRTRLKILRPYGLAGSSPATRTKS